MNTAPPARPTSLWQRVTDFAEVYGWWRVVAIPVLSVITVVVIVDILRPADTEPGAQAPQPAALSSDAPAPPEEEPDSTHRVGPDPAAQIAAALDPEETLPPGGAFTIAGEGTFRPVGNPGANGGEGRGRTVRYAVAVEDGIDTSGYGGDGAFAAMIDATLLDPRGWTVDPEFRFEHVAMDDNPDTTIQLTSVETTARLCGAQLRVETSCHTTITGASTVIINESRWVRGAWPFEGDLGNYRQYLVNHEFGHAIGFAEHQACGGAGQLAPVMMQQTLSLNNAELYRLDPDEVYPDEDISCEPNPWPYPRGQAATAQG